MKAEASLRPYGVTTAYYVCLYHHCPSLSPHNAKSPYPTFGEQCNAEGQGTGKRTGCAAHHWPLCPSSCTFPLPLCSFFLAPIARRCLKKKKKKVKKRKKRKKKEKGEKKSLSALAFLTDGRSSLSYLEKRAQKRLIVTPEPVLSRML